MFTHKRGQCKIHDEDMKMTINNGGLLMSVLKMYDFNEITNNVLLAIT